MRSTLEKCQRESGFSNAEWANLMKTVRDYSLDPANYIGLEGFKVHKQKWEVWLDVFLDTRIGKQYWGILKGKKWIYGRDREAIRKLFRNVVMLTVHALNRKRGLNRLSINQERLEEGANEGHKSVGNRDLAKEEEGQKEAIEGNEEEGGGCKTRNDDADADADDEEEEDEEEQEEYNEHRRTGSEGNPSSFNSLSYISATLSPIRTVLDSPESKGTGRKETPVKNTRAKRPKRKSTGTDDDDDDDLDYQPSPTPPKRSKESRISAGNFDRKPHSSDLSPSRVDKPAATKKISSWVRSRQGTGGKGCQGVIGSEDNKGAFEPGSSVFSITRCPTVESTSSLSTTRHPPLVFRTRVTTDTKHLEVDCKFVYTENAPSLPVFLERAHRKHRLEKEQKINSLQVQVGSKRHRIDYDDPERDWDWHVVMDLLGDNKGPIDIVLDIA